MDLEIIFNAVELLRINGSEYNFCKKMSKIFKPIILVQDDVNLSNSELVKNKIKEIFGSKARYSSINNEKDLKKYLIDLSSKRDWVLFFTNKKILLGKDNIVCLPYSFWGNLDKYKSLSFTEHAKYKLLYNTLSTYYMDAIANDTKLEADFLMNIFELEHVQNVIDCCCGVGRHDYILAKKGYNVVGIDVSSAQIATAKSIHSHNNIQYIISDVRNFQLSQNNYDAGICMWTTYNYFSQIYDLKLFIYNLWRHLKANGILILDSKNIPILDKERLYTRERNHDDLSINLLIYKRIIGNIQNSQYFYFINDNNIKHFLLDEEFVRFYHLNELIKILKNKFKLISVYGDFYGNAYHEKQSERMISVWRVIKGENI